MKELMFPETSVVFLLLLRHSVMKLVVIFSYKLDGLQPLKLINATYKKGHDQITKLNLLILRE